MPTESERETGTFTTGTGFADEEAFADALITVIWLEAELAVPEVYVLLELQAANKRMGTARNRREEVGMCTIFLLWNMDVERLGWTGMCS
jgi:hypothetical protein